MGYTHYYQFKCENIDKAKFANAVELFKECLKKVTDVTLCDGIGEGEPIISDEVVCFNGSCEKDEDYESFSIDVEDTSWNCCKTARQPYDIAVCLCLLCFKEIFEDDFEYSSDGVTREKAATSIHEVKVEKEWDNAYKIFDAIINPTKELCM